MSVLPFSTSKYLMNDTSWQIFDMSVTSSVSKPKTSDSIIFSTISDTMVFEIKINILRSTGYERVSKYLSSATPILSTSCSKEVIFFDGNSSLPIQYNAWKTLKKTSFFKWCTFCFLLLIKIRRTFPIVRFNCFLVRRCLTFH